LNLSTATYKILYNNKNITQDISDHLISLTYTDKVSGESDELELSIEDSDLLWQNAWYPGKGAKLTAEIINDGRVLNCGNFTIDELEMNSSRSGGDVLTIKAIATGITKTLRTKRSTAHENKNLREIINTIAAANGLTVMGNIDNIIFNRITQYDRTDLDFLAQLASDYGYTFSIRDTVITFTSIYELEGKNHILTLDKTEITAWSIKDKTAHVYKAAKVQYHNPDTNTTVDYEQDAEDIETEGGGNDTEPAFVPAASGTTNNDTGVFFNFNASTLRGVPANSGFVDTGYSSSDMLAIKMRVENRQQAEARAKAALHKKNTQESDGSIATMGNVLLVAGVNFELTGMGTLSGIQHIVQSSHTIDRSGGYITAFYIKRIKKIPASKHRPKQVKAKIKPVNDVPDYLTFKHAARQFEAGGAFNNFGFTQ
jgi:phage protein D